MAEYPDRLKDVEYSFNIDPTKRETWDHTAYREDMAPFKFPKDLLMYLPEPAQRQVLEMDFVLPFNEAMGLIKEAQAQRYSMARKLNDPQSRGFHGGDPERVGIESLTNSPIEERGRRYASAGQKYESSPNVYRAVLPESTLLTNKYMGLDDTAEPAGNMERILDKYGDFPRYGAEANAYYSESDDLIALKRDVSPLTEAHEFIHRGFGSVGPVDSNRQGPSWMDNWATQPLKTETEHDYIRALFDQEGVDDYDYLIEALRDNLE